MDGMRGLEELEAVVVGGNYLAEASDHVAVGGEVPAGVEVIETIGDGIEVADGLRGLGVWANEGGHGAPVEQCAECIEARTASMW